MLLFGDEIQNLGGKSPPPPKALKTNTGGTSLWRRRRKGRRGEGREGGEGGEGGEEREERRGRGRRRGRRGRRNKGEEEEGGERDGEKACRLCSDLV